MFGFGFDFASVSVSNGAMVLFSQNFGVRFVDTWTALFLGPPIWDSAVSPYLF